MARRLGARPPGTPCADGSHLLYVHINKNQETVIWDGHFAVNEQANPKQMDWTPLRKHNRNPPANLAIYHLEGDILLVIGHTEAARPTAFYSGGGAHHPKTVIFRRVTKEAAGASEGSSAVDVPSPKDLARVELDKANVSDPLIRMLIEQRANVGTLNQRGQIRDMSFENAALGDSQLAQILAVKSLERIDLRGTRITDEGVARLKELPNLKCLILWSTNISDRGLEHVVQNKSITFLAIPGGISDDGMALLSQLPNLESLDLQECIHLGEDGFKHVEQLKQLKTLMLNRTFPAPQVSVERLRQALPNCHIHN